MFKTDTSFMLHILLSSVGQQQLKSVYSACPEPAGMTLVKAMALWMMCSLFVLSGMPEPKQTCQFQLIGHDLA